MLEAGGVLGCGACRPPGGPVSAALPYHCVADASPAAIVTVSYGSAETPAGPPLSCKATVRYV